MNKVGRPLKYKTPKELKKAITKYFNKQDLNKELYTMSGLALSLGFLDCRSLVDYGRKNKFYPIIKVAKTRVMSRIEKELINRKSGVAGLIFWLKNISGWKDKRDIIGSDGTPITINLINYDKLRKIDRPMVKELPEAKLIKTSKQDIKKFEAKR